MSEQIVTTPGGERLVVLSEAEYLHLAPPRKMPPACVPSGSSSGSWRRAKRNRFAVWRDCRSLTSRALAHAAGFGRSCSSQIEAGRRDGAGGTMKKIADARGPMVGDLV